MAVLCQQQQQHLRRCQPFSSGSSSSSRRAAVVARAQGGASLALPVAKPTLVDVPVSNHGARVRHILYTKGLEGQFDIVSPGVLGGLASPEFKALNAQGKMPLLLLPDGLVLPESEVIAQYILDKWAGTGPSLVAATPELRAVAALATRIHDQYITPIQSCMYRKHEAGERAAMLQQLVKQLDVLEALTRGPFIAGAAMTGADSALLPTFVFLNFILPRYFGWADVFAGRPQLRAWWDTMQQDPCSKRVIAEVTGGLEGWAAKNRWEELGIVQQLADSPQYQWAY